jgi:arginine-tRNA-protein transferase
MKGKLIISLAEDMFQNVLANKYHLSDYSAMILLSKPAISDEAACPYIESEICRFHYFFAREVSGSELEYLLSRGWRKFGLYYFKPVCVKCRKCIPIRLKAGSINVSRSQKRVLKKGELIRTEFREPEYRDEIFELYRIHSEERFGRDAGYEDFINSFYTRSCPSLQSEYYIDNKLIAAGFLDRSGQSLSSIYFVYDTEYLKYSPGTLSILREAEYAASIGLTYYYLGYYIEENRSMSYKNSFNIHETMDWETETWQIPDLKKAETFI